MRTDAALRRLIGYVPQQLSADGTLTGRENVALFARRFDVPRRVRRSTVDAVNPLGYEVDALRGLLIGTPAELGLNFTVLILACAAMISVASALLGRLVR
jgi:hypothetical protein